MRTLLICLTLVLCVIGASFILKNPTPGSPGRLTDHLNKKDVADAVEKEYTTRKLPNIKSLEVTEVRANDEGTNFCVYSTFVFVDGHTENAKDIVVRDEYGVWTSDRLRNLRIVEKQ